MRVPRGYIKVKLRCPICKGISTFFWHSLTEFKYTRCQQCNELSATDAYGVVAILYAPEPFPQSYPCQFCGELDCEKDHLGENGQKIMAQYQRRKRELGAKGGILVWGPLVRRFFKGEKDKANSGG